MITEINIDEIIKKRVTNKELYIKNAINKYLELKSLIENEGAENTPKEQEDNNSKIENLIWEIYGEIDNLELQIIKAGNIVSSVDVDIEYQKKVETTIKQSFDNMENEVKVNKDKLEVEMLTRSSLIECEEIAKVVNSYKCREEMENEIESLEQENVNLEEELLEKTLAAQHKSSQINLLINIMNELKKEP